MRPNEIKRVCWHFKKHYWYTTKEDLGNYAFFLDKNYEEYPQYFYNNKIIYPGNIHFEWYADPVYYTEYTPLGIYKHYANIVNVIK